MNDIQTQITNKRKKKAGIMNGKAQVSNCMKRHSGRYAYVFSLNYYI